MKPHSAPPRKPAAIASGRWTNSGSPWSEKPTKVATIAPRYSWPSAPMLNRPLRNPRATARPVKMSGRGGEDGLADRPERQLDRARCPRTRTPRRSRSGCPARRRSAPRTPRATARADAAAAFSGLRRPQGQQHRVREHDQERADEQRREHRQERQHELAGTGAGASRARPARRVRRARPARRVRRARWPSRVRDRRSCSGPLPRARGWHPRVVGASRVRPGTAARRSGPGRRRAASAGTSAPPMYSPSRSGVASAGSRMATIRPWYMTAIRSPRAMTSSSSVETIRTAAPSSRFSTTRRWMYSMEPTSRPRVGCAATSSLIGRVNSRATMTFCWLPPDRLRDLVEHARRADVELRDELRRRREDRVAVEPQAVRVRLEVVGVEHQVLGDGEARDQALLQAVLGHVRDAGLEHPARVRLDLVAGDPDRAGAVARAGR